MRKSVHSKAIWITVLTSLVIIAIGITVLITGKSSHRKLKEQLSLGEQYCKDMNYGQARFAYEKALQIDDMNVEAYIGLANVYEKTENLVKAKEVLENGIDKTNSSKLKEKLAEITAKREENQNSQKKQPEQIPCPDNNKDARKGYIKKLEQKDFSEVKDLPDDFTKIIGNAKSDDAKLVTVALIDIDQNGIDEMLFNTGRYMENIYVYSYKDRQVLYCGMLSSLEDIVWEGDFINYEEGPYVLYYNKDKVIKTSTIKSKQSRYEETEYGYVLTDYKVQPKYRATEVSVIGKAGESEDQWLIEDKEVTFQEYAKYKEVHLSPDGEVVNFMPYIEFLKIYKQ